MKTAPNHFSQMINEELQSRMSKNAAYSLRALARDIEVSPSILSQMMKKKYGLTEAKAKSIAKKLNFNEDDKNYFCALVKANCARKKTDREIAQKQLFKYENRYNTLATDQFRMVADWFHFAIMELTQVKGFKLDYQWIAQNLGITENEVTEAIERMLRLEILTLENNKLSPTVDYVMVPSNVPSEAGRRFHKQLLQKAITAIDEQDITERNFSSVIFKVRKKDIPLLESRLKEIRRELARDLESGEDHDSVYALGIQLFRLDN